MPREKHKHPGATGDVFRPSDADKKRRYTGARECCCREEPLMSCGRGDQLDNSLLDIAQQLDRCAKETPYGVVDSGLA